MQGYFTDSCALDGRGWHVSPCIHQSTPAVDRMSVACCQPHSLTQSTRVSEITIVTIFTL